MKDKQTTVLIVINHYASYRIEVNAEESEEISEEIKEQLHDIVEEIEVLAGKDVCYKESIYNAKLVTLNGVKIIDLESGSRIFT